MFLPRLSARLLAAGAAALVGTASAPAQWVSPSAGGCASPGVASLFGGCGATNQGTFGPSLFARNKPMGLRPNGGSQPLCANNNYPLSDWNYIRKYCGPTFVPGSCYGHFQTKWRKWEDICPEGATGGVCGPTGGAVYTDPVPPPVHVPPPVTVPAVPAPAPATPPMLMPVPVPKADTKPFNPTPATPVDPVAPPKVPAIPKLSAAVPAQMPAESAVTTITAEQSRGSQDAPVVRPLPEAPRVVVPPLPDTPQK